MTDRLHKIDAIFERAARDLVLTPLRWTCKTRCFSHASPPGATPTITRADQMGPATIFKRDHDVRKGTSTRAPSRPFVPCARGGCSIALLLFLPVARLGRISETVSVATWHPSVAPGGRAQPAPAVALDTAGPSLRNQRPRWRTDRYSGSRYRQVKAELYLGVLRPRRRLGERPAHPRCLRLASRNSKRI